MKDWSLIRVIQWASGSRGPLLTSITANCTSALLDAALQGNARVLLRCIQNEDIYWAVPSPDGRNVPLNLPAK